MNNEIPPKREFRVLYFVGVGIAGNDSNIFVQESRQASTSVMLIHEERPEVERPVGAGAVGTQGGDACVARGEGQGKRSSAHAPSRINPSVCHPRAQRRISREGHRDPSLHSRMTLLSLITIHRLMCIIRNAYAAWPNSITLIHEGRPEAE